MTERLHPTVYKEELSSLNLEMCQAIQTQLEIADEEIDVVYNILEEILDQHFQYPDYRHHM